MIYKYDPEDWLLSTTRAIKSWVEQGLDLTVYEVLMGFPGAGMNSSSVSVPFSKAMVHFEVDAIDSGRVGFGDGAFALNYDEAAKTVTPQYGEVHNINFDVGIWTSDRSGGGTARLLLRQHLQQIFGVGAVERFRAATDKGDGGVAIINFTGGRNTPDAINDVPVYRTINSELEVRVFSRTKLVPDEAAPAIEQIDQSPGLTILG